MKANKKAFRIIAIGLLITNSNFLLFQHFTKLPGAWLGILQGVGIGIMIGGLIKMKKKRKKSVY